jgi:Zn-finger nucleic acid-binding protein
MNKTKDNGEVVLYKSQDNEVAIDVLVENESVWLNRQQMAKLFDRDIKTIGKHINNALKEELAFDSTVAKFATTARDGKVYQMEYYNIDMIMSVGYRVKSNRGIQFRAWANRVLKDYLLRGYAINQRFERIEQRLTKNEEQISFFVRTALPPKEGVFYDGQIFDAHVFVSDLVKSAKKSLALIDNYVDETVLLLLSKRRAGVDATIYAKHISAQLQLDWDKHNAQYEPLTIRESNAFHDRFLVVDNTVYHLGASLKDLAKRLFAFSKMEVTPAELLKNA